MKKSVDIQFGENVRCLREKRRLTQKFLASKLDMDVSSLNRIENGISTNFKPKFFLKLCECLDCTLDELFKITPSEYIRKDKEMLYQQIIKSKDVRIETLEKYIELLENKK